MGLSVIEICAIVFASFFILIVMIKCCMTVSLHNKAHTRGVDVGHDNDVYMHPQNEVSFLQDGRTYGATYTQTSGYPLVYNIHGNSTPVYYYPQPASPVEERRDLMFAPSYLQHCGSASPPSYAENQRSQNIKLATF